MAAAALTTKFSKQMHLVPIEVKATQLTTLDWINIEKCPGVVYGGLRSVSTANNTAPGAVSWEYGVAYSTAAYTATDTSIAVDGMGADATNPRLPPYYMKTPGGEIVYVTADSTPAAATSTLTIRRGCLGTTAAVIADNDVMTIMNQIVVTSGTAVGTLTGLFFGMDEDPGAKTFNPPR